MARREVDISGLIDPAVSKDETLWLNLRLDPGDEELAISLSSEIAGEVVARLLWAGIGAKELSGTLSDEPTYLRGRTGRGAPCTPAQAAKWGDNSGRIGVDLKFGTVTLTVLLDQTGARDLVALIQEATRTAPPPAGRA